MNGWVKGGPTGLRWHQCEWDSRNGTAKLLCSGKVVTVSGDDVMDYRWSPPWREHCLRPQCQAEVEP